MICGFTVSKIKNCFISRFSRGVIMEADFSQLEVIGLAYLSQDPMLYEDILTGADMHCINASFLYDTPYATIKKAVDAGDTDWTKKRKTAKAPGFLIQYGGGAKEMAAQTGLKEAQCKQFITNYYNRYRGVKDWQDYVAKTVASNRKPSKHRTDRGIPAGVGYYQSITGRRYVFREFDAPEFLRAKGKATSFSPTQMKNYPVQGFATGDIVPLVLGKLYRNLKQSVWANQALLINTVHDSVLLDVSSKALYDVAKLVKATMQDAPNYLKEVYGIDFDLPLNVSVDAGPNWGELHELKLGE
jgi:DNA polymerase I-like protein with 3'-5' exonuclease and polymerase domains